MRAWPRRAWLVGVVDEGTVGGGVAKKGEVEELVVEKRIFSPQECWLGTGAYP